MAKYINKNLPFEDFKIRPGKAKKARFFNSASDRAYFKSLINNLRKTSHSFSINTGKSPYFRSQNSYVNASYLRNKYPNQWSAHGRYLQRKGAQKELEVGLGFNAERDDIPIAKLLNLWQQSGDERVWKFIISPEASDRIDLKEHAIKFMEKLENDLGRKFDWVAIDHYNTAQFHLHFCIRGVDLQGLDFKIEKAYVKEGARKISKQLLTEKLGLRTDEYILERRSKALHLKHVTELDRVIEKSLNSDHFITISHGADRAVDIEKRSQIMSRLEFLETLGLAKKDSAASWYVEPTFIDYLRFIQEQNDILKLVNKHKDNIIDKDLPVIVNKLPNQGDRVIGRVIGSGLNERNEDFRYIFIEGIDGQNHYVTANNKIMNLRDNKELLNGDIICLERSAFIQEDKKISFIKVDTYNDFNAIKMSPDVNNVDRFIIEKLIINGKTPGITLTDNVVRQEFLKIVNHRINFLKSRNILNDHLEVNRDNLEISFKRKFQP